MPQYVGSTKIRPLTERQAHDAYARVIRHLRETLGYSVDEMPVVDGYVEQGDGNWPVHWPVLVKNYGSWSTTSDWAIVWEGGAYDWAIYVVSGGRTPDGIDFGEGAALRPVVFAEPIESFSLGLYRAT
jgi:hypothetical protein